MLLLEIIARNSLWSTACQKLCWNVLSTSLIILRSLHTWLLTSDMNRDQLNSSSVFSLLQRLMQTSPRQCWPCCWPFCALSNSCAGSVMVGRMNAFIVYRVYAIAPKQCCDRQVATGLSEFSICWDAYRPEWRARPLKLVAEMIKAKQKQHRSLGTSWRLPPMNLHPLSCGTQSILGQQKNKNQCR